MDSIISGLGHQRTPYGERDHERESLSLVDEIQVIPDGGEKLGPAARGGSGPAAPYQSPNIRPVGRQASSLRRHLAAGDVVALALTWGAQGAFRTQGGIAQRAVCTAVAVLVTLAVMRQAGLYRTRICALRSLEAIRTFASVVVGASAFAACLALAGRVDVAGAAEAGAASTVLVLVLRWRFGRWLKARRSASRFLRPTVIVGTNEDAHGLWTLLKEEPELGFLVTGVVGPVAAGSPWEGMPHRAEVAGIPELASLAGANGLILVASALDTGARSMAVEIALAAGLHVQVWPGIHGLSSRRMRMAPVSGVPLLYIEPPRAPRWALATKRAMDLVLGTSLLVASAPVIGIAALAVKLSDRGPVLYRSQRAGRSGVPIEVLKLRTMVPNAAELMSDVAKLNERKGGPLFKASADPRVTKVGRILRATSVDELPQLWNVIKGTMSLVGPRPALLDEVQQFDSQLHRRHEMRPGMTGLWQVEARDNPSFSAYRRLDLSYIDDWSLSLDLAILASTAHEIAVRACAALIGLVWHRGASAETTASAAELAAATKIADLSGASPTT